mgnify:CR=1 FL=1
MREGSKPVSERVTTKHGTASVRYIMAKEINWYLNIEPERKEDWDEIARPAMFPTDWYQPDPIDGDELGVVEVSSQSVPHDY